MRIVIMGTGPFAVPTSQRLVEDGHEISLVVTRPLIGKSKKPPPRPVFDWATAAGFTLFEPESINTEEAIGRLREEQADLFFVCDYGQILSKDCLAASRLGGINLHGSLLPRHRGAAPVQWAVLRGDEESGVTVIHMTPGLDAGPALAIARTPIKDHETAEELEPRLAELGVEATVAAVCLLSEWDGKTEIGEVQDRSLVTKAPRFHKQDGQLDFRLPVEYLVNLVRACQPWPGTYAELVWPEGKRLRVIVRKAVSQSAEDQSVTGTADASLLGRAFQTTKDGRELLGVSGPDGTFFITLLQPAGKREMAPEEFLRGHPVTDGCRFELPEEPRAALV